MLKMRKITDQAFLVLAWLAKHPEQPVVTARAMAQATGIAGPTAAKVLKTLHRAQLVSSSRGLCVGYTLAKDPSLIRVTEVIEACEGPIGLTDCTTGGGTACAEHPTCSLAPHWAVLHHTVLSALGQVTLRDLTVTAPQAT